MKLKYSKHCFGKEHHLIEANFFSQIYVKFHLYSCDFIFLVRYIQFNFMSFQFFIFLTFNSYFENYPGLCSYLSILVAVSFFIMRKKMTNTMLCILTELNSIVFLYSSHSSCSGNVDTSFAKKRLSIDFYLLVLKLS